MKIIYDKIIFCTTYLKIMTENWQYNDKNIFIK